MSVPDYLVDTRTSYDTVAESYADMLRDALADAPYERAILALFAELVRSSGGGPVVDVGCGPGRLTGHLHTLGLDVSGVDLSPGMIDIARRDHPGLRFTVGSMTELDLADVPRAFRSLPGQRDHRAASSDHLAGPRPGRGPTGPRPVGGGGSGAVGLQRPAST